MAIHNITGKNGEDLAAKWLTDNGYILLQRNWRHKHWEVDIVAHKGKTLHIVEVKTRTGSSFGHPEESITDKKMQYLINAAEEYMYQNPQWQYLQFDVLSIVLKQNGEDEYFLIEDVYL